MMKSKTLMTKKQNKKIIVGIFDFTDCEGCQVKLISLRDKFLKLEENLEIIAWRLGQEKFESGPYDIAIVEGTPIMPDEVKLLKAIRENSKILIALGTCAALGGIPAILSQKEREYWYQKIYGPNYKPRGIEAQPLSFYVPVDIVINGCPVDENEVLNVLENLLAGKKPYPYDYPVCYDCKKANNDCRILKGLPCLGPITKNGCGAICISGGSPCYGCFGLRDGANVEALIKILEKIADKKTIALYLSMFHKKLQAQNRYRQ